MDILDQLTKTADQVEVVTLQNESTKIAFEANRFKASQVEQIAGVAVRVVKNGRLGFAASSDASASDKLVTNVLDSAAYGDELPIAFPAPGSALEVNAYDPAIVDMSIPSMVEMGQDMVDIIIELDPGVQVNMELERGVERRSIRNQAGTDVSFKRSPLTTTLIISRVEGDDVLLIIDIKGATLWDADHTAFVHVLGEKLQLAKRRAAVKSGRMPILFAPTGALVLGLPLRLGLDGKNVFTGISPLADKTGQKLFDSKVTIVDDPTLDGRLSSAPYDDEGVAHRRNVLVDRGVLKGFMYDLKTAAQAGVESTGNGARSLFQPPSPAPTNLLFEAGETPLPDIIGSIEEGLLVEQVLGLGQGNIISGAFSNALSLAFKIEKGEIVGRVKDVSIAGNVYELLQNVAAVSQETEWVYGSVSLPYLLLGDMNVVAKA